MHTGAGRFADAATAPVQAPGARIGEPNTVRLRLADRNRRTIEDPQVRLGLGIYRNGPSRPIPGTGNDRIAEVIEHDGHLYRLADVRATPAAANASVEIDGPAGTPFVVVYGGAGRPSEDTSGAVRYVALSGVPDDLEGTQGSENGLPGPQMLGVPAQPARKLTARLSGATPKDGHLMIAIYTPLR